MSDFRKARVILTAVYKNGDVLKQDHAVPARVSVLPIPGAGKFRELSLRMVVAPDISEELLEGICRGTVSLNIEQMLSPVERETNPN
jgi:hypothetical protein